MIVFNCIDVSVDFNEKRVSSWIKKVAKSEGKDIGQINYIFCDDSYLIDINKKFLDHDTYTDIITFDNTVANYIGADIYISIERVSENAINNKVEFNIELLRVIVHGVLHLCGYKDKSKDEASLMRAKEDEKIKLFHVELE